MIKVLGSLWLSWSIFEETFGNVFVASGKLLEDLL